MKYFLLAVLSLSALVFAVYFFKDVYAKLAGISRKSWLPLASVGFVLNFFDTLGIGSFAPTTSFYKFTKLVDDRYIPGTLNVGHCLPVVAQALIFIAIVDVDPATLVSMMLAATLGAVAGAGVVAKMPVGRIRLGLGLALLILAFAMFAGLLKLFPAGGSAVGLSGWKLVIAVAMSVVFGALQTIGIGFYAPCMALVFALGMDPRVAFPVMMGSAAMLMPWAGLKFVKQGSYDLKASLGLSVPGVVGVLLAAYVVKSLPLTVLKWVIVAVILYASILMFRSAFLRESEAMEQTNKAT